jgi:hypothetical protein
MKYIKPVSNGIKESGGLPAWRHCMVVELIAPRDSGNSFRRIVVPCGYETSLCLINWAFTSLQGLFINLVERMS